MTAGRAAGRALARPLVGLGDFLWFSLVAIARIPLAIRQYPSQIGKQLAEVSLGGGALVVGGGAVGVVFLMAGLTGTEVGLEGHNGLDIIGLAPLVGFVSGYANTRELAPIVVALAFAARIGCGFTSRLGAQRISEEIDALESMSIRPIPYLVSTRIVASLFMVIPLFLLGLVGTYLTTDLVVTTFFNQSAGTYDHYFQTFVSLEDILLAAVKVTALTTMVTLVHCWFGYFASGGPEGVGRATGLAIRTSIIGITLMDIALTLTLWGPDQQVTITG